MGEVCERFPDGGKVENVLGGETEWNKEKRWIKVCLCRCVSVLHYIIEIWIQFTVW